MPPPKLLLLELPAPRSPLLSVWICGGATLRQAVSTGPSAAIISAMLLPLCDSLITFHLSSLSTSGGTSTACLPLRWRLPRISEGVRTVDGKGMPLIPGDGICDNFGPIPQRVIRDETRNGGNSDRIERVDEYIKASKQHRSSRVPPSLPHCMYISRPAVPKHTAPHFPRYKYRYRYADSHTLDDDSGGGGSKRERDIRRMRRLLCSRGAQRALPLPWAER
jgi:hypothetical protein